MATSTTMGQPTTNRNDKMNRQAMYWIAGAIIVLAIVIAFARNYQMQRESVIESTTIESTVTPNETANPDATQR